MTFRGRLCLRFVVSLCVLGTLIATPVPAAAQGDHKRVLLLFDEDRTLPGLSVLEQAIRSTLSAELGDDVEFFTESMHAAQFPEEQHDLALRDYFLKKYGSRKLDLIVGVMGPAVTFLRQHGDTFAPGVPIVFCGADARDLEGVTLPAHMTGLLVRRVFAPTLDIALRLQPDTRQVFVVGGTSEFDRHLQAAARREFEPFERRVSFTYLTDLPMKDLLAAVSSVPPRSVILYLTLFRDGAGQTFVPHDAVSRISAAARAPVYVFVDQYLGLGPVGGYLYSLELHGKASAEVGLRVLRGESTCNHSCSGGGRQPVHVRCPAAGSVDTRQPTAAGRQRHQVPRARRLGSLPGVHHRRSGPADRPDRLDHRPPRASRETSAGRVGAAREFCAHP